MAGFKMVILDVEEDYEEYQKAVDANPKELGALPRRKGSEMGASPLFFDFILDISGSMSDLYDELVICFNEIMIPSLHDVNKSNQGPMRIGCLLFSSKMIPAWWGYKSLSDLGPNPLKREMFHQAGLQDQTALYGAMRAGVLWTSAAMENTKNNSPDTITPKGKIIVLSDGANNIAPLEPSAVTGALASIGKNRDHIQRMIGFFNTSQGLTKAQFDALVKATGFTGSEFHEIASGESLAEKKRSFRNKFELFSRYCLNK